MSMCADPHGSRAMNIATKIEQDIAAQKLNPGARLLPLRQLAEKYGTSYLIVRKAINLLCEKGLLTSRHGSGIYLRDENSASSSLRQAKKNMISIAFCGTEKHVMDLSVYSELIYGIEKEAARQMLSVVLSLVRNAKEFRQTDIYANACGFLLVGENTEGLESVFKNKPVVWVMGTDKGWGDHLSYNNRAIGVLAADNLVSSGHKHLVCINVHPGHGDERCRAFKEHAESMGADVLYFNNPESFFMTQFEQHIEFAALEKWVHQIETAHPRPTAAFVVDLVAQPLCFLLSEKGIKPGRDIEIVTCNWRNMTSREGQYRPLTIDQHPEKIGMMAVRQLQWRISNPDEERIIMKMEPSMAASRK